MVEISPCALNCSHVKSMIGPSRQRCNDTRWARTKGPRQAERRALETLFEDVRANARRELSAYGSYSEQQVDALAWERAHAVFTAQRHRPPALPAPLLRA